MDVNGKKVVVVGLARSGVAASRLLASRGAEVLANDIRTEAEIAAPGSAMAAEVEALRGLGVGLAFGTHPEAAFLGADLIVVSPGVPPEIAPLQAARRHGVEIISEPELAGRFLRGRVIGVTGSNGKTTTTMLIGELMKAAGADVIVGGNIGTALSSLVDGSHDRSWTVAELSSFQLETIDSLRVHVAVLTNLTPDHLDRHGTFENYVRAKWRIFQNQTEDDFAVLNFGDKATAREVLRSEAGKEPMHATPVWYSRGGLKLEVWGGPDLYVQDGAVWTTVIPEMGDREPLLRLDEIQVPGRHNVENIMAALAATICAMRTSEDRLEPLRDVIRNFTGVEHRIEFVAEVGGVRFYNDSKATNVDSTVKSLEAFEHGVIIILGGKDKGSDYTVLTPLVEERVKQVVLLGAASDRIAAQLAVTRPLVRATSMQDAVEKAYAAAASGDVVLLAPACASFDMFENYEHRGHVFKEAVHRLRHR